MTGRTKFLITVIGIITFFVMFILIQSYRLYSDTAKRSPTVLLAQYYRLIKTQPDAAKRALDLIIAENPDNLEAQRELGFWYLKQGDTFSAFKQFNKLHQRYPNDERVTAQLNQLRKTFDIPATNSNENAKPLYLTELKWMDKITMGVEANFTSLHQSLQKLEELPTIPLLSNNDIHNLNTRANQAKQVTVDNVRDHLLNQFYQNRMTDKTAAWQALDRLLALYPNDVIALKEAGYFALGQNKLALSASYFERVYDLTQDPYIALQTGYILSSIHQNRLAYHYFTLATDTKDLKERLKAELALTNLRGADMKLLPEDFYVNIMFDPFYQSRFQLLIYPIIARAGYIISHEYNTSVYLSYRRTSDNKSESVGQLPQIYEDNAAITAIGLSAAPFKTFPILGFIELGKAVDLVYKDRSRWRNDFRTGVAFYTDYGREARYTFRPMMPMKFNGDIYADAIYYSRYLNTIATARIRPGVEVFRVGSASINVYFKTFISEDRDRIYYNNIMEAGPGISFTPSDRYNLTFRYETLRGFYLPCSTSPANPYKSTYRNNYLIANVFIGI